MPNAHSRSTFNAEPPHIENPSTTELPNLTSGGDTYHVENNPVDTDQTLLKVVDTDPAPPAEQTETLSVPYPVERNDTTPQPTDSYSNTPSSGSEVSLPTLHRVSLNRAPGVPMTLITMPSPDSSDDTTAEAETSFITPGQASPDSVVTEPLVTVVSEPFVATATPDETNKSSINPAKWNGDLYRRDVNKPDPDETIQPVQNIPQEFGIQVRENAQEYLVH